MIKTFCITALTSLAISGAALAQSTPTADPAKPASKPTLAECEKMSGAAREACVRDFQAAEGKAKQPSTGGTVGSGTGSGGTAAQPSPTPPSTGGTASGK